MLSACSAKRGTGYDSYLGVPLLDETGGVIGHIAVYSSKPRDLQDYSDAFLRLCASRAEVEVLRLLAEDALKDEVTSLKDLRHPTRRSDLTVAHDLRAPLAAVDFSSTASPLKNCRSPSANAVENARAGVRELLKMSNEYLDLYRNPRPTQSPKAQAVELNAVMRIAAKEAALLAANGEVDGALYPFG